MAQTKQMKKIFALRGKQPSKVFINKQNLGISDPDLRIKDVKHGAVLGVTNGDATRHFGARSMVIFSNGKRISFIERLGTKEAINQARKQVSVGT